MKIGIIYATQREEATVKIVDWIKTELEAHGCQVIANKPQTFQDFDCDAFIIGSAVYAFSPNRNGMGEFLDRNKTKLARKPIGVFIASGMALLEHMPERIPNRLLRAILTHLFPPKNFLKKLTRKIARPPLIASIFYGYKDLKEMKTTRFEEQQKKARDFAGQMIDNQRC